MNRPVWTTYATLRSLIDAQGVVFSPNITFDAHVNSVDQVTNGNLLSRAGYNQPRLAAGWVARRAITGNARLLFLGNASLLDFCYFRYEVRGPS
jgi:hypothetical protein